MFDVASQSENTAGSGQEKGRVLGRLDIRFCNQKHRTGLAYLYQNQPLRVLFPTDPTTEKLAVWINMAGGIVGGDQHDVNLECGKDAVAMVTGQAAEKIYRSCGAVAKLTQTVTVAPGSWLELLPQGTILFNGCRLHRVNQFNVSPGAQFLAGEIITFGRVAMMETFLHGLLRDEWRIYRDGKIQWADFLHIGDNIKPIFETSARLNNAKSIGIFLYAADDAFDRIDVARQILSEQETGPNEIFFGATAWKRLLLVRWLGQDPAQLRKHFGAFWAEFRSIVGDQKAALPSLWNM